MAPHSSTLAQKIPWMEEPGRLQSMGLLELDTTEQLQFHFSLFTFMHWRRKWQPTPVFLPGESQGREPWWAAVYGVAQSWTRLKRCSSSSSSSIVHFCFCFFYIKYLCCSLYSADHLKLATISFQGNSISKAVFNIPKRDFLYFEKEIYISLS